MGTPVGRRIWFQRNGCAALRMGLAALAAPLGARAALPDHGVFLFSSFVLFRFSAPSSQTVDFPIRTHTALPFPYWKQLGDPRSAQQSKVAKQLNPSQVSQTHGDTTETPVQRRRRTREARRKDTTAKPQSNVGCEPEKLDGPRDEDDGEPEIHGNESMASPKVAEQKSEGREVQGRSTKDKP
ncbi:hypothetical protein U1Q18_017382 [Sarracenia purpurea var. burkii]